MRSRLWVEKRKATMEIVRETKRLGTLISWAVD
jgi:hypothetical protein